MKKNDKDDTSLPEILGRELEELDTAFQLILRAYTQKFTTELDRVRRAVAELKQKKKLGRGKVQDLRDMLMLVRQLEIKPAKGKRRDLKRLEALTDDLNGFVRDWESTAREDAAAPPKRALPL